MKLHLPRKTVTPPVVYQPTIRIVLPPKRVICGCCEKPIKYCGCLGATIRASVKERSKNSETLKPKMIMQTQIEATIIEAGNGLPGVGALVYDAESNTVYRIVASNGRISTNGCGCGNSIDATLEEAGDPSDYSDEEWEAVSDCRVDLAE
jgi:hypothetical protein